MADDKVQVVQVGQFFYELSVRGAIGTIEFRNTLASLFPEFEAARDRDVDNALLKVAEVQANENEALRIQSERRLREEEQEWEREQEELA